MLGQGARAPRFTCCPQIQKLAGKIMEFVFLQFRRTDKVDSVMKGMMGQCPPTEFFCARTPLSEALDNNNPAE